MMAFYSILLLIFLFVFWIHTVVLFQYAHCIYTNLKLKLWKRISLKLFLNSFFHEILALNFTIMLLLRRFIPIKRKSHSNKVYILIHGYFGNPSDFSWFAWKLKNKTHDSIYSLSHSSLKSIPLLAEEIRKKMKALPIENKEIILIGHSLGGLIASYIAENLPIPIKKTYCLGSPFYGTPIARFGFGASCKEMSPKSSFLKEFIPKLSHVEMGKYHFIWSILDNTVFPAPLKHDFKNQKVTYVDHLGHLSILFSNQIFKIVLDDLKRTF